MVSAVYILCNNDQHKSKMLFYNNLQICLKLSIKSLAAFLHNTYFLGITPVRNFLLVLVMLTSLYKERNADIQCHVK